MSQENVELVRQAFTTLAEQGVEAWLSLYTDDAVIHAVPEWPDDAEYYGHEGLRKFMGQWNAAVDGFEAVLDELRDAGDAVAARFKITGRIVGSQGQMAQEYGAVFSDFRAGRIGDQRLCSTWADAIEVAGRTAYDS